VGGEIVDALALADMIQGKGDIAGERRQQGEFLGMEELPLAGPQGDRPDGFIRDDER
jgi:hypothetical protein